MGSLANLVLFFNGASDNPDASVFGDFHLEGKMVSLFLCDGKNLGKSHSLWHGILLQSRARAGTGTGKKLYAGFQSHVNDRHHADAGRGSKSVCFCG